ncbi:LptF/LptG family permease [Bdellovibrionota bacterium FG-2]
MPTRRFSWRYYLPIKIDWYVLGEVFSPFVGGVVFFIFIFLMFQMLRLAELFIKHGIPGMTLLKMTALLALSFMPTALPVAFLIAILVAFGRLSSDSELVALKASGMSVLRLSAPITLLSLLLVVLSVFLNNEWVPWGERTFKNTLIKVSNTKAVANIREGTFNAGFFDLLIFADKVDPATNRMSKVFIFDEREAKNPVTVVANAGEIVPVKMESELGAAAVLRLYNGGIHRNDIGTEIYQKINFGEYRLYLKVDEGTGDSTIKPRMILQKELSRLVSVSDETTYFGREYRGEYWRRISVAITPIIFVFLGIGFGTTRTRSVRAGAALVAFSILLVYWGIQTSATIAVQNGTLPAAFAMQIPNIILVILAIFGFKKASW